MSTGDAWSFDRLSITSPKAGSFEISDLQSDSFFEYNLLEKSLVKSKYLLLLKGGSKDTGLFLVLRGYDFPGSGRELRVIHLNQENLERSKQVFQSNRVDYVVDVKTCEQTEHICLVLKPRDDRYDRTVYVLQNDTFALDKKLSKELMKSYGHRPTSYSQ